MQVSDLRATIGGRTAAVRADWDNPGSEIEVFQDLPRQGPCWLRTGKRVGEQSPTDALRVAITALALRSDAATIERAIWFAVAGGGQPSKATKEMPAGALRAPLNGPRGTAWSLLLVLTCLIGVAVIGYVVAGAMLNW